MKIKDMKQIVNMLYDEWDLGKTSSCSRGKVCALIYLFEILEESSDLVIEYDNKKVIGICSYVKYNSRKHLFKRKIFHLLRLMLIYSPYVKDKHAFIKYNDCYDYTPIELKEYFDGEVNILIVDKNYRGMKIGKRLLEKTFCLAKKDNIRRIKILSDESCNFKFYESCGCKKIYETIIDNGEIFKCNNSEKCIGYIFEKNI